MNSSTLQEAIRIAADTDTPPETLRVLATHEHWEVRSEVADNPNAPPETLQALAEDEHEWVRSGVACNRNTPTDVLQTLAGDESLDVRSQAMWVLNKRGVPRRIRPGTPS